MAGFTAADDRFQKEILDDARDVIDRLGLRVEYPKSVYWAESGVQGIRVLKGELWLPRELKDKLNSWAWKGLVASALAWREVSRRKLTILRQVLPITIVEGGLVLGLFYYSGTRNFSPILLLGIIQLFIVFMAIGALDNRRYRAGLRFRADERAARVLGRANLVEALKRVQTLDPTSSMYYGMKVPGPGLARRIARLEKKSS